MMLKREAIESSPSRWRKWMRAGVSALGLAAASVSLAVGCLDRPVTPQEPNTSNLYVAEIRQTAVDKIDLLFMIDNSISMADKQEILREAVPVLVQRLVTPVCIGNNGQPTGNTNANGQCANGEPEFTPIKDIHIGIVTSSLGAHGGDICTGTGMGNPTEDDRGYPLGKVRNIAGWNNTGFLAWDPDARNPNDARNDPPGEPDQMRLVMQFQDMVSASGEVGCGYEASLEAWYRFLVDPHPPTRVFRGATELTETEYPNQELLTLRNQFLRKDSLVAIIMLTDENDCSIIDEAQGWLVGATSYGNSTFRMPRSTSACATDPNSKCCTSCAVQGAAEPGCTAPAQDASCMMPAYTAEQDHLNLRCYKQRMRFGLDLLYPVSRYVRALTEPTVVGRDGSIQPNPLITSDRDKSLVFLAGIVGVPWQDIATPDTVNSDNSLEYMTYEELAQNNRFDWLLGTNGGLPRDPLMFETPEDRTKVAGLSQTHPVTMEPLVAAGPGPASNSINGKESTIADGSDLQYACIFPLGTPRMNCADTQNNCDCRPIDNKYNRALCNGNTQTHAKAYPGT
ncbi:MAG TPA: hypothetical protein VIM73_05980, partial [Polyangiaceae bacterium]